jgi:hypothetical protein
MEKYNFLFDASSENIRTYPNGEHDEAPKLVHYSTCWKETDEREKKTAH